MKKAVFCLANNEDQAQRIVNRLLSAGFANADISVLLPNRNFAAARTDFVRETPAEGEFVRKEVITETNVNAETRRTDRRGNLNFEKHTKAPEAAVTGATAGGVLGGSIGLLAGLGALAIPGLGPFIAAGPIMAALSGLGFGGGLGLIIGALIGAGIPEYEAIKYEEGLLAGNALVSVHTDNEDMVNRAYDIMKKEGATEISTSREKCKSFS